MCPTLAITQSAVACHNQRRDSGFGIRDSGFGTRQSHRRSRRQRAGNRPGGSIAMLLRAGFGDVCLAADNAFLADRAGPSAARYRAFRTTSRRPGMSAKSLSSDVRSWKPRFDCDPQARVDQPAHGFLNSDTRPRRRVRADFNAADSASAVSSSRVRYRSPKTLSAS